MKKNRKSTKDIDRSGAANKIHLPYYNNYPEDDINIEFVNEEEKLKQKKRKTAKITVTVILCGLAALLVCGFFLLREFVFYPDFTKATGKTLSALAHDTEFNFAKFESEGQTKIDYSYDGTSVSYWETHKNANSNMRITVDENGDEQSYQHIVKGNEFAVKYGGNWYGASAKNAENNIAASDLPKLSSAEATYLLNYLGYVAKSADADKDERITANFAKKVFSESSISVCDSFRGIYGILDSERYVKSRVYAVTNENLAELLDNFAEQMRGADIRVQTAFRNWADINIFKGTKTFNEMLEEIEKYADEIREKDSFTSYVEICYTGQELSALLISTETEISNDKTEHSQIVADFYYNGAMISTEKKTVKADGTEENKTLSELQITVQTAGSSASYRIHTDTDGITTDIKLLLDNSANTFELTALCGETEAFAAKGVYSDTKEQVDLKVTSVTRGGKEDKDFKLALTFYYKSTDIEIVEYRDILSMSESDLRALKDNVFDWELPIPADRDELDKEAKKFFGLDELIDKAKENLKKQQEAEASKGKNETKK